MRRARFDHRPFETLVALRESLTRSAAIHHRPEAPKQEGAGTARLPAPSVIPQVITEDLPGAWIESMLFNPGSNSKVWSEMDALRYADAEEPRTSPHPRRLREYGRRRA